MKTSAPTRHEETISIKKSAFNTSVYGFVLPAFFLLGGLMTLVLCLDAATGSYSGAGFLAYGTASVLSFLATGFFFKTFFLNTRGVAFEINVSPSQIEVIDEGKVTTFAKNDIKQVNLFLYTGGRQYTIRGLEIVNKQGKSRSIPLPVEPSVTKLQRALKKQGYTYVARNTTAFGSFEHSNKKDVSIDDTTTTGPVYNRGSFKPWHSLYLIGVLTLIGFSLFTTYTTGQIAVTRSYSHGKETWLLSVIQLVVFVLLILFIRSLGLAKNALVALSILGFFGLLILFGSLTSVAQRQYLENNCRQYRQFRSPVDTNRLITECVDKTTGEYIRY